MNLRSKYFLKHLSTLSVKIIENNNFLAYLKKKNYSSLYIKKISRMLSHIRTQIFSQS